MGQPTGHLLVSDPDDAELKILTVCDPIVTMTPFNPDTIYPLGVFFRTMKPTINSLAALALTVTLAMTATAAPFTAGNLAVQRVGTGTIALSSAATAVFVDEITTAGVVVQSLSVPTNSASVLLNSGTATSEGAMSLSTNGQLLSVVGYSTNYGAASVAGSSSASCPRVIGTLNGNGLFNLAASNSTSFNANNIRGGVTDGAGNYWAVGANSGVVYMGTGAQTALSGTVANSRVIRQFGGNLYYSTGSGNRGIIQISGTPTSGSLSSTNYIIPTGAQFGTNSSPYAFVFDPTMSVAYVADTNPNTNSASVGGVEKWTNNAGVWGFAYTLAYGTNGATGLAVDFSQANPVVYGTTALGTSIFKVVDTGASSVGTLVCTAPANELYHGLSLAPVAPPSAAVVTPTSISAAAGSTATFSVSCLGSGPLTYAWYFASATATNLLSTGSSTNLVLTGITMTNNGNYFAVVSNSTGLTATSTVASLSATFVPGNLVVERVGNGLAALSGNGTPIFLDEFTTSGTPVQTAAVPTNGPSALVDSGSSSTEGQLTLAANGQSLVLAGYNIFYGATNVAGSNSVVAPRAVGSVTASGNFTLGPVSTTNFNASNIRGATSDGNGNFWAVGSGGAVGYEGVCYMGLGTPSAIAGTIYNSRTIQDIGGNLFYATGSGSRGILEITGLPTSGLATTNYVIPTGSQFGTVSSPYGFVFNPAFTVVYVADSNPFTNSTTVGGIEKWTNNAGVWGFAYTLGYGNNGFVGLTANFSGANPVLYATTANGSNLVSFVDTGVGSTGTLLATAPANTAYRSLSFAPTNVPVSAPVITGITPASLTTNVGANFTLVGSVTGSTPITYSWLFATASSTNVIAGATTQFLTVSNATTTNSGNYFLVVSNASTVNVTSAPVAVSVVYTPPTVSKLNQTNVTAYAGAAVTYTVTAAGAAPFSYAWYFNTAPITGATNASLILTNVTGANGGNYQVVVSNLSTLTATSVVATLTVIDPSIVVQPSSAQGVVGGVVKFGVTAAGVAPLNYQWYFTDASGNLIAPATSLGDGSVLTGATTSLLTLSNLQPADLTNFAVVVSDAYGSVTSAVASVQSGYGTQVPYTQGVLALWDFDGSQFTNTGVNPNCIINPTPFIGYGTAAAVGACYLPGTSPFSGAVDPLDVGLDVLSGGYVFTPYGFEQPSPNFSWGTDNYPQVNTASNKNDGVQFNVSTVGARNIHVAYDSRATTTASLWERLQYTTNGTTWIDYPASSTFSGLSQTTGSGGFYTFNYDLTGFPGVDNNPNFGVRVVTEWASTATYGVNSTNYWIGNANTYASAGTVTYDIVAFTGDAITNSYTAPVISSFMNTNMAVTNTLTIPFTAFDAQTPASNLTWNVQSLNTVAAGIFNQTVLPNYSVVNTGSTNFQLKISFNPGAAIPDPVDATPVLITATDTNGLTASAWFNLTVTSINAAPTNTLTSIPVTNVLANSSLTIPFSVGSANQAYSNLTFSVASGNNMVLPAANMIISGNTNTGQMLLTLTPAPNQVGNANVSVTVYDNFGAEPRQTTATLAVQVQPNTNVVAVETFSYDNSTSARAIDANTGGYWQHLSGPKGQMQFQNGAAIVDTADNTENVQAPLLGGVNGPTDRFTTNSGLTLYASFWVNMSPAQMPTGNGTYFLLFNNGNGSTGPYEGRVIAATNGAANGYYRLGVNNFGAYATDGAMFPQDLTPGQSYFVVMSLVLSNGHSTIWISPTNQFSASVTHTQNSNGTNLYNMADIELRESGSAAGSVAVSNIIVGLSFDSVFYPAQANPASFGVAANSTNVLSPLSIDDGWGLVITNLTTDGNGTATISGNGTNITYVPNPGFTGTASVAYTIQDNLGNNSTANLSVVVTNAAIVPVLPIKITAGSSGYARVAGAGSFHFAFTNVTGAASGLSVYGTTNLTKPFSQWVNLGSPTEVTAGNYVFTNLNATNSVFFYTVSTNH